MPRSDTSLGSGRAGRKFCPASYGLSEDAGFAGTSHPEQTLGPRSGSARTAGPRVLSRWTARQLKEEQFSPELVSRPIPWLSKMRWRPKQFGLPFGTMARLGRGEPCSDAARCRPGSGWNWAWRILREHEGIVSGCEVNRLIAGLYGERLPSIDLAHVDLSRGKQRPEQHGCGVC